MSTIEQQHSTLVVRPISIAAAIILTVLVPLVAIVVAFVMLVREKVPARRLYIRWWLGASLAWSLVAGEVAVSIFK